MYYYKINWSFSYQELPCCKIQIREYENWLLKCSFSQECVLQILECIKITTQLAHRQVLCIWYVLSGDNCLINSKFFLSFFFCQMAIELKNLWKSLLQSAGHSNQNLRMYGYYPHSAVFVHNIKMIPLSFITNSRTKWSVKRVILSNVWYLRHNSGY